MLSGLDGPEVICDEEYVSMVLAPKLEEQRDRLGEQRSIIRVVHRLVVQPGVVESRT
jgi:hypothetical protein